MRKNFSLIAQNPGEYEFFMLTPWSPYGHIKGQFGRKRPALKRKTAQ
tara:strand:+ start:10359 stop:10499 length:141 start_codon:yes stop_codon:yes gene_type:complete